MTGLSLKVFVFVAAFGDFFFSVLVYWSVTHCCLLLCFLLIVVPVCVGSDTGSFLFVFVFVVL